MAEITPIPTKRWLLLAASAAPIHGATATTWLGLCAKGATHTSLGQRPRDSRARMGKRAESLIHRGV